MISFKRTWILHNISQCEASKLYRKSLIFEREIVCTLYCECHWKFHRHTGGTTGRTHCPPSDHCLL